MIKRWYENDDGCWVWTGGTDQRGRPTVRDGKTSTTAARAVWRAERGKIPKGRILQRTCATLLCVKPDHHLPVLRSDLPRNHAVTDAVLENIRTLRQGGLSIRQTANILGHGATTIRRGLERNKR